MTERLCLNPACGKPILRKPGERDSHFRVKVYCSRKCCADATRKVTTAKRCEACGCLTSRRKNEAVCDFLSRKTCSNRCKMALVWAARRGKPVKIPKPIVYRTESPEEWLKQHSITKCPTRYAAPIEQQTHIGLARMDGRVR